MEMLHYGEIGLFLVTLQTFLIVPSEDYIAMNVRVRDSMVKHPEKKCHEYIASSRNPTGRFDMFSHWFKRWQLPPRVNIRG